MFSEEKIARFGTDQFKLSLNFVDPCEFLKFNLLQCLKKEKRKLIKSLKSGQKEERELNPVRTFKCVKIHSAIR